MNDVCILNYVYYSEIRIVTKFNFHKMFGITSITCISLPSENTIYYYIIITKNNALIGGRVVKRGKPSQSTSFKLQLNLSTFDLNIENVLFIIPSYKTTMNQN